MNFELFEKIWAEVAVLLQKIAELFGFKITADEFEKIED